ncbi:SDR family oxidoreductase [Saccharothrix sp. S26]|uniref:SDR family oxidoreductase n=1 Tax=Saccharothrix sp. S26 TaxID=2907215 RepID=UPI001F240EB8|nr:SDR family oxidoreductase [Saccharothrix sp. S26]MCE6998631.1 SDR family oxidoreductase [Saccharothrix sp. S26]
MAPVSVVTGAGSGVGRVVARALLDAGHRVALAGRRADPLAETAAGVEPDRVLVVPTDITVEASVDALFDAVRERWGRVDVLFNNAGTNVAATPLEEFTLDQWSTVIDTNLTGAFLCARAAYRVMRDQDPQGGRIINNGSVSAHTPRPDAVAYNASKHAITGLTKSISLEGRRHRIACGQIDIGNAATPMTERMTAGVRQADGTIAAEPTMDVAHVADAVRYMAALPLEANVQFMTVMATTMPFIGRG